MKQIINNAILGLAFVVLATSATPVNKPKRNESKSKSEMKSALTKRRYQTFYLSEENVKFITVGTFPKAFYASSANLLVHNQYRLAFQTDYNFVLYNNSTPIWASGIGAGGNRLDFIGGGQIYRFNGPTITWNSNTFSASSYNIWVLQSDGNFVGYDHYSIDTSVPDPIITVDGSPFAATGTAGGKKSSHSGRF